MKLGYVIVYVADVAATVKFYEAAFNLECRFAHESGMYSEMETGGTVLAFANEDFTPSKGAFTPNRAGQKSSGAEIAFLTSDVEKQFSCSYAANGEAVGADRCLCQGLERLSGRVLHPHGVKN
jgi:lactoylglutathione lyase